MVQSPLNTTMTCSAQVQSDLNAAGEMRAMVQELMAQVAELQEAGTDLERQALKHRGAAEAAQMQIKVQSPPYARDRVCSRHKPQTKEQQQTKEDRPTGTGTQMHKQPYSTSPCARQDDHVQILLVLSGIDTKLAAPMCASLCANVQALRQELGSVSKDKASAQTELVQQGSLLLDAQASSASLATLEQQKSMLEETMEAEKRRLTRALTAQCAPWH